MQEFDKRLTNAAGERVQLEHAYHRGEHEEDGYKIDAYAEVDGRKIFYEYLGCYYHPDCGCKDSQSNNWGEEGQIKVIE